MMTIATIIVTFNRKNALLKCIEAICLQKQLPDIIYIIDNNSNDGTDDLLKSKGLINNQQKYKNINLKYVRLPINGGGSMGFYEGLRLAHTEGKYDYYWVMDDDGEPHPNCLKELINHRQLGEYLSPLVVDIESRKTMAFGKECSIEQFITERSTNGDIIHGSANPFNGILYSKKYLDIVGYPEPKMFIWGDEINYDLRGRKKKMSPVTICTAIHYHPRNRAQHSPLFFFGLKKVIWVNCKWKMYCRCCNAVYNYKLSGHYIQIIKEFFLYNWFFLISMHSWAWVKLFNTAFINGLKGKFGGHRRYM